MSLTEKLHEQHARIAVLKASEVELTQGPDEALKVLGAPRTRSECVLRSESSFVPAATNKPLISCRINALTKSGLIWQPMRMLPSANLSGRVPSLIILTILLTRRRCASLTWDLLKASSNPGEGKPLRHLFLKQEIGLGPMLT